MNVYSSDSASQSAWETLAGMSGWKERLDGVENVISNVVEIVPGQVLYDEGDRPTSFYVVGAGEVAERVKHEGRDWFERRLGPGDFFGQQGLYAQRHTSRAVATESGFVHEISAAGLTAILDASPAFWEELLPEKRAQRLRGIPLFRSLSNAEIRWLALVVKEVTMQPGDVFDLDQPGVWVLDYGRVQVDWLMGQTGTSYLTAGNFFLTPAVSVDSECVASQARIDRFVSHLFFLPASHIERLASASDDIKTLLDSPLQIERLLRETGGDLFGSDNIEPEHLQHLAQFCGWEFVPANQNITTQGRDGHSFVILREGAAVVTSVDQEGRQRPRHYMEAGTTFGRTSLLEGRQRNATVRAVRTSQDGFVLDGADIINLDRRDMVHAFASRTDLWHEGVSLFDLYTAGKAKQEEREGKGRGYDWLREEEVVDWQGRRHPIWLWLRLLAVFFIGGTIVLLTFTANRNIFVTIEEFWLLLLIPAIVSIIDYFDDYYAVTNRRVTRSDRKLIFHRQRVEAPIEQIEDVTVSKNWWGNLLGYGTVNIRTAATAPPISFTNVPQAETVRQHIMGEKATLSASEVAQRRERLRQGLMKTLKISLPTTERIQALGPKVSPPPAPVSRGLFGRRRAAALRGMVLGERRAGSMREEQDEIVWLKHWLNMLSRVWKPGAAILVLLITGIFAAFGDSMGISGYVLLAGVLLFAALLAWFAWEFADYKNDKYILTRDMIIDIEKKPLGISSERRTANLDRIETVNAVQKTVWANLFNYGDIVIRTAAADQQGLDFKFIGKPSEVQRIVYERVGEARRRREDERLRKQQQELRETLDVYHELTRGAR